MGAQCIEFCESGVHPTVIKRFEPWFFMANVDLPGQVDGVSIGRGGGGGPTDPGSNAWAIAPSKTENGRAVLFSNPHVGLFGRGQRYECHVTSGEGWNFSGFAILGNPIPHAGHNDRLGWSHTNTGADSSDAYREEVEGNRYRVGKEWRPIREWKDTVGDREVTLRATHRGPLVGTTSVRVPIDRLIKGWEQKLAMGKARNLAEFRRALAMTCLVGSNTTYADADGHIAFWYANSVPRRNSSFDWSKPVDGTDPKTEWQGFFTPDELPHVIDPRSGFVQNCNSDPWQTTTSDNPDPKRIPPYVVRDRDTARAANSRRILLSKPRFGWNELTRLAFDTYVYTAAERVPLILSATKDDALQEPLKTLKDWNYRSSIHSVAATLYFETELDLLSQGFGGRRMLGGTPDDLAQAFSRTIRRLKREFGTWRIPWGQVNRLRRTPDGPTLPVPGAPSAFGQIFAFGYPFRPGGIHYGTEGNTYVALTEFGPSVTALSLCGFGQSADPASPHFFDQAPLYASGRFKPAWFTEPEVQTHAPRTYHP